SFDIADLDDAVADDELEIADVTAARLATALRNLSRRSVSEWNDKGLRVLHLAAGALEWEEGEGDRRRSPLVLVPVELTRENPRQPFRLVGTDEDWSANAALAVKLEQDFGISLPAFDDEGTLDAYL